MRELQNAPLQQKKQPSPQPSESSQATEGLSQQPPQFKLSSGAGEDSPPALPPGIPIQPKLTLGAVDDPYEKEADSVAKEIVSQPKENFTPGKPEGSPSLKQSVSPFSVQAQANADFSEQIPQNFESNLSATQGGGQALPKETRGEMENAFGADFSGVKIHTGSDAVQMSKDIGAHAFTQGEDIYFNQGAFSPQSNEGRGLLAHELTHVVQQKPGVRAKRKSAESPGLAQLKAGGDAQLFRKQISQFKEENSEETLRASRENVLDKSVNVANTDSSQTLRRCSRGSNGGGQPQVDPHKVAFTGSHAMQAYGADPKANPVWTPGTTTHAAAYTVNHAPVVNADFGLSGDLEDSDTPLTIRVKEGGNVVGTVAQVQPAGGRVSLNGLALTGLTGSDAVGAKSHDLTWEGSQDGTSFTPVANTSHLLYWLVGAPTTAGPVKNMAVAKATGYVNGNGDVAGSIRTGMRGELNYDPADAINGDPLTVYGDGVGICTDFGNLLTLLAQSVGLAANTVMFWGGFMSKGKNVWVCLGGSYTNLTDVKATDNKYHPGGGAAGWDFNYHVVSRIGGVIHDAALDRVGIDADAIHQGRNVELVEGGGNPVAGKKGDLYNEDVPRKQHTVQVTTRDYGSIISNATFNDVLALKIGAAGGGPAYQAPAQFAVTGGALPPGIALNPLTGKLAGTPNAAGVFPTTFTVRFSGASDTFMRNITVNP